MYQSPDLNAPHHTMPTAGMIRRHSHVSWRLMGAYIIAALGVGVACACLWLLHSYKTSVQAQMTQLRHAVATAQTAQSKNASRFGELSSRISSAEGQLVLIAPYTMVCSQYLTGPNGGPATFYFPCGMQKPGSGS